MKSKELTKLKFSLCPLFHNCELSSTFSPTSIIFIFAINFLHQVSVTFQRGVTHEWPSKDIKYFLNVAQTLKFRSLHNDSKQKIIRMIGTSEQGWLLVQKYMIKVRA